MESLSGTFRLFRIQLLIEAQQGIKNMAIETGLPSVFTKKMREEGLHTLTQKPRKWVPILGRVLRAWVFIQGNALLHYSLQGSMKHLSIWWKGTQDIIWDKIVAGVYFVYAQIQKLFVRGTIITEKF